MYQYILIRREADSWYATNHPTLVCYQVTIYESQTVDKCPQTKNFEWHLKYELEWWEITDLILIPTQKVLDDFFDANPDLCENNIHLNSIPHRKMGRDQVLFIRQRMQATSGMIDCTSFETIENDSKNYSRGILVGSKTLSYFVSKSLIEVHARNVTQLNQLFEKSHKCV